MLRPGYHYSKIPGGLMRTKVPVRWYPPRKKYKHKHKHDLLAMGCGYYHAHPVFCAPDIAHLNPCPPCTAHHICDPHNYSIERCHCSNVYPVRPSPTPPFCCRIADNDIVIDRDSSGASRHHRKTRRCTDGLRCNDDQPFINERPDRLAHVTTDYQRDLPTRRSRERHFAANGGSRNCRDDQRSSCRPSERCLASVGTDDCMPLNAPRHLSEAGLITFEAAAAKLNEVSNHACNFFHTFQTRFQEETYNLSAYANRDTIRAAWKDKILRNEKYNNSPKEGWTQAGNTERKDRGTGGDQHNWSGGTNNDDDRHTADNGASNKDGNNARGELTTFGEYQHNLKRNISMLLNCEILEPRLRYGHSQDDDDVEPEDLYNIARHDSAHKLRQRVGQCQKDLLPLLHKIREDHCYMEGALIELKHLASLLETYSKSWKRPA